MKTEDPLDISASMAIRCYKDIIKLTEYRFIDNNQSFTDIDIANATGVFLTVLNTRLRQKMNKKGVPIDAQNAVADDLKDEIKSKILSYVGVAVDDVSNEYI